MYELTSFLETIAAASASIVAILGGFIASKLISINSDRDSSIERVKQVEEELQLRRSVRDKLQKENEEDDALDFVDENIESLVSEAKLSDVYDSSERPLLSQATLNKYWEKALEILSQYCSSTVEDDCQFNSDNIPLKLAQKYTGDTFAYEVCQMIGIELDREEAERKREEERKNNPFAAIFNYPDYLDLSVSARESLSRHQYSKNLETIEEQNSAISLLELEKNQIDRHINANLRKPKGMKMGLGIFIAFAVLCIICPLVFTPYSTDNIFYFHVVKFVFLGLFLIGLAVIFAYLVYLLRWEDKTES